MKDFLGNELNIGDEVVFLQHYKTSSTLYKGKIQKITNCFVFISDSYIGNVKKEPCKCVKVTEEKWIPISFGMPEDSNICNWYKSHEMDFTTVWATVENEYGHKDVRQMNRILIKTDPYTHKHIPEEEREWKWSNNLIGNE